MSSLISKTLQDREEVYGSFEANAEITQRLISVIKSAPKYSTLSAVHREAYRMIFHKISRSACGDGYYADNVEDIIGYATLLKEHINKKNDKNQEPEDL